MTDSDTPRSFLQKACQNCRLRKIRCDKRMPCSSCQTLGIACQAAPAQTVEHRPRVVVTSQYERQISLIQERLQSIESSLKQLSQSPSPARQWPMHKPEVSLPDKELDPSIPIYEGGSSFGNQTLQASQMADVTASTVLGAASNEVATALLSLKHSLKQHKILSRTHESHLSRNGPDGTNVSSPLPPAALLIALIKRAKTHPPFCLVAFAWRDISQVESLCQRIFFPIEPLPTGATTLLCGLFYYIIRDYMSQDDPVLNDYDASTYLNLCERNFCAGLETYESLTVPVLENIQALLIGAIKAQEECKLSLCWTFIGAASTMCHTLGYHRKASLAHEPPATAEIKRHVFWQLYMIDKNLSLNLGRSSNFQDSDIDAEFFTPSSNPMQLPWDMMALATIAFARVQGKVYEKLYSASALQSSVEERSRAIEELSSELLALRDKLVSIDVSSTYFYERLQGMVDCADFISNSVLTVIHRAQPLPGGTTEISFRCYEAARLSLESHLRCFAQFFRRDVTQQSEYVNWFANSARDILNTWLIPSDRILLYPSFIPFVVVFIHAIATTDTIELQLLQETVRSLDHVKVFSRGARRLHDVCAAFVTAATALIESQRTLSGWSCREDGSLSLPSNNAALAPEGFLPDWTSLSNMEQSQHENGLSMFLCGLLDNNRSVSDFLQMDLMGAEFGGESQ